jgi:cytoskeletal protein CcmA (bactofilin family)
MAVASIIGPATTVRGNVRGSGSLDVRGRVEGDIEVDGDVALGEEGVVSGNISGAQLTIAGSVQGDLRGSEAVLLERGARVIGDLVAPRIGIAEGALVRGGVRTEGEASPAPRRAAVVPARRSSDARPRGRTRAAEKNDTPDKAAAAAPAPGSNGSPQEQAPKAKPEVKGPPAPVVPSLGKGARGKKKSKRA